MTELEAIEQQHIIRLARWSAALGTLGLLTVVFGVGVLLALIAIGCAMLALNQLAALRTHDAHGIALLGLIAGVLALLVFPLLLATAVPRFIAARQSAEHERCYANLNASDRGSEKWLRRGGIEHGQRAIEPSARRAVSKCPSGGEYRIHPTGVRCSIPLHNEPPGIMQPPRRLRFSYLDAEARVTAYFASGTVTSLMAPTPPGFQLVKRT